jgi:hypothetical protein
VFSNTGWFASSGGGVSIGVLGESGAAAFKLSFAFLWVDHRLCMDLFKAFEPCLIHCGYKLFSDFKSWNVHPLQLLSEKKVQSAQPPNIVLQ